MNSDLTVDVQFEYPSGFSVEALLVAAAGEITKLTGPSGSGKSTLLRLVAGLLPARSGQVRIGDRVLFSGSDSINLPAWKRRVGLLFQQDALFPHLSVRENLLFGAVDSTDSAWTFDTIVETFAIRELLERKPDQLSGGQRDRVALGRTLLSQPAVLLLDEPLNSVEDALRDSIVDYVLQGIASSDIACLLVSHDSQLISRVSGPTIEISDGQLCDGDAS